MKKIITVFEDLWVAISFAEAGAYDILREHPVHVRYESDARLRVI